VSGPRPAAPTVLAQVHVTEATAKSIANDLPGFEAHLAREWDAALDAYVQRSGDGRD